MLSTITPPHEWARSRPPIDVLARRQKVFSEVYKDGKRKIYNIRAAKGFSGPGDRDAANMDFSGCSFHCGYCFVNPKSLSGKVDKPFLSPYEAFGKLRHIILKTENPQVQFNGGEVFLAPNWTLKVIELLCDFFQNECEFTSRQHPGHIWCDTMGFDLIREQKVCELLVPFRKHVALFISTKGHPEDYEVMARAPRKFADDAFLALERAYAHGLVAVPEVIDRFFWPQTVDWYMDRLLAIDENAPRVLHMDQYSRVGRVPWSPDMMIKLAGFRPNKSDPERNMPLREEIIPVWQDELEARYGKLFRRPRLEGRAHPTFCCDVYPDACFRMVERLILKE